MRKFLVNYTERRAAFIEADSREDAIRLTEKGALEQTTVISRDVRSIEDTETKIKYEL